MREWFQLNNTIIWAPDTTNDIMNSALAHLEHLHAANMRRELPTEFIGRPSTLEIRTKRYNLEEPLEIAEESYCNLQKERETTGSVVIPQLMCWWNDKLQGASAVVLTRVNGEYDMYYHHQRMMGGRDNYGWLRTMYHSIGQQLMRQDPAHYLWPDHAWKLVSYPYYAKYAKPGDKTGFCHIDVNVADTITN
uniref:Uncharacterized protein n=1 Tax=Coccidioides posadasii RMSCC 3488 TaxID=454284 RepID=A0A0J6IMC5_COCPO|nr:hypothetical protein CPAG_09361 [Coccidioides posadasii RMSCC 3488]